MPSLSEELKARAAACAQTRKKKKKVLFCVLIPRLSVYALFPLSRSCYPFAFWSRSNQCRLSSVFPYMFALFPQPRLPLNFVLIKLGKAG